MRKNKDNHRKELFTVTILLGILGFLPQMVTATDYFSNEGVACPTYQSSYPQGEYFNNKTYVVYMGANYTPYVMMYDHILNEWSEPVQMPGAWNSPPGGWSPNDNHFSPGILRDNDGYLHVYGGCHNCDLLHARSDYPDDISSWTFMPAIHDAVTYPYGVTATNGDIYIFFRRYRDYTSGYWNRPMAYVKSINGGDTWSEAQNVVDYSGTDNWVYTVPNPVLTTGTPEKIHLMWHYKPGNGQPCFDMAYGYLNLSDEHMYSINGVDLGTTVTKTESDEHCMIFSGRSGAQTLQIDSNDYPHIINNDCAIITEAEYQMISWNGTDWEYNTIMSRVNDTSLYPQGSLILHNEADIDAYMLVYSSVKHSHWDGSSWSEPENLLDQSNYHFGGICILHNHINDMKFVFSEWAHTSASVDKKIYAYGNSGFVGSEGVGIDESQQSNISNITLHQNYPNPVSLHTAISYTLSETGSVSLAVYDISGKLVETLVDGEIQQEGNHSVQWDTGEMHSGIYFYRISSGNTTETRMCTVLR